MIVQQTVAFGKQKKKLHANQIKDLDDAITAILQNPKIGTKKRGDLSFIHVYKFNMVNQECLLAYQINGDDLILLALGSHQNFYQDLKRNIYA